MSQNNFFDLTLDTLAPTGSITRPAATAGNEGYINANGNLTIVPGDAAHYAVWFDTNASGTLPETPTWKAVTDLVDGSKEMSQFTADGAYYYHLALRDNVGNISEVFNTDQIFFDTQDPEVTEVKINDGDTYTRVRANKVTFTFNDILKDAYRSGVSSATISGNIVGSPIDAALSTKECEDGTAEREFTFTNDAEDGPQTITITIVDKAGNTASGEDTITLDTQQAEATISVYNTDNTAAVPTTGINYLAVYGRVGCEATDWADYKVWTGETEPETWTNVTATDKTNKYASVALTLAAGDGNKTVYAKVRDEAQKEAGDNPDAVSTIILLDQTAPTVSIVSDEQYVSAETGYTEFTLTNNVVESGSGQFKYELTVNGTKLATASGDGDCPDTFALSYTDLGGGAEGAYELILTVWDKAVDTTGDHTNVTSSAPVTVYVDLTAPSGTVSTAHSWYGGDFVDTSEFFKYSEAGGTTDITDGPQGGASGVKTITCWCDTTAASEVVPSTAQAIPNKTTLGHSDIDWTNHADQSAGNYLHIKMEDNVGNISYCHSSAFGIDTIAPAAGNITLPEVTETASLSATITVPTEVSAVNSMKVYGDIKEAASAAAAEWKEAASSYAIVLTDGDGDKTVYVMFRDTAGNVQTADAKFATTELDTTAPTATLVLVKSDGTTPQPSHVSITDFKAQVSGTDDGASTGMASKYKIYGDFAYTDGQAQGITEEAAQWVDFVWGEGVTYNLTEQLYATTNATKGETIKTVYLKVMDNAGNPSAAAVQTFYYDDEDPEVNITTAADYMRVSKVHTARNDNAEKFNDEVKFTFTPTENIQAYKVCAYLDKAAANAGSHEDDPIKQVGDSGSAGSTNMHATGLDSNAAINAMIKGADYEAALGDPGEIHAMDGLHYVVVYVEDLGGRWSKAAEIPMA